MADHAVRGAFGLGSPDVVSLALKEMVASSSILHLYHYLIPSRIIAQRYPYILYTTVMTSTLPPLVQAFSGAVGSASANAIVYPLDLVATRLQTTSSKKLRGKDSWHSITSDL